MKKFYDMVNYLITRMGVKVHYDVLPDNRLAEIYVDTRTIVVNCAAVEMTYNEHRYITYAHELGHLFHFVILGESMPLWDATSDNAKELVADMFANWLLSQYNVPMNYQRVHHYANLMGSLSADELEEAEQDFRDIIAAFC